MSVNFPTRRLRRGLRAIVIVLLALASLLVSGPVLAQKAAQPGVIDLGEIVVEGKVQKPQVFYVLGRAEFRYRGLNLERSFVPDIVASARRNPF